MRNLPLLVASAALLSAANLVAQIPNEDCSGALPVIDGANGPFSTVGATTSVPAWPCAAGGADIWFVYVATATGAYDINLCTGGTYDTALEVFDGTGGCGALVSLACNDDSCGLQSRVNFTGALGTTYYIRMGGYSGATGSATLTIVPPAPPIPNTLLTTFANNNFGNVGNMVYFDLNVLNPAGLTLTSIDVNLNDVPSTVGAVEIYLTPGVTRTVNQTNAAAWTLSSFGNVTAAGAGGPSPVTLTNPIPLAPGLYGVAFKAIGVTHAYTNGNGANQNYANADLGLAAGEASNVPFTAPIFSPRVVNTRIYYAIGSTGTLAVATQYGVGCVTKAASLYEHFPTTPSIDLSNWGFQMLNTGAGYFVLPSTAAFVAPSPTATNLNLGDDAETTVTLSAALPYPGGATTTLNVCSNGHISTASNGAAFDYTPTPAELLGWANTTWAVWRDFVPTTSGPDNVYFEEIAGTAYITWLNVLGYNGTSPGITPSTFQLQFNLTSGSVDFVFLGLDTVSISGWTGGEGWVVGYSPGGPSLDPGSTDLTVAVPGGITLAAADVAPLALAAQRPLVNTTINLTTSNIGPTAPFGAVLLSFTGGLPGLNLTGIGMPGCWKYNNSDVTLLFLPGGSSSFATPFAVPNFVGVVLQAQSAVYDPAANLTPLGAISSNGVALTFGDL
ncbi:MAG: hypothetical protein FJ265_02475 [Planctomycetes bacterium]|nr:hypothetical protein [Planctomycetota bacterium]